MKYYYLFFIGALAMNSYSQEFSFATGVNFTTYKYKNSFGERNRNIDSERGNFYEFIFLHAINKNKKLKFQMGGTLNEYNASGRNGNNSYSWESTYLGLKGGFIYNIFPTEYYLNIAISLALNLNGIIDGTQRLNGIDYDLREQPEFNDLFIQTETGLSIYYNVNRGFKIGLGYQYSLNNKVTKNSSEVLGFSNNQIQFKLQFSPYEYHR
jgi:hypothetical protein|tara:strand:+ start:1528 stop:2157 length:630 start_codon:yes stop_codon:yes gene_type:complete